MQEERPRRSGFAGDFRVGEWLVEPSLDRLSRNGTVLRLRPQLVDMLVLLAQRAGETVSKDEILANVWDGQHVAESGMTRCIAEIRQALGDAAREPRIVQTIPKRGYRLVAPVEFLERPAPDAAPTEDSTPAAASNDVDILPRRSRWGIGALLASVLLLATLGAGRGNAPAALSADHRILLADVTNTTGDKTFDGTLRLALAVHLGQAPTLLFVQSEHVRSTLSRMGRRTDEPVVGAVALEVCRREGAAVLLAGSIARLGSRYAVGLEAIACATGESVGRQLHEADGKDDVLEALEAAALRMRRTLGESRASLRRHDAPLERATTPSLEALKALSLGDYSRDHARLDEALTFYRRATELDPRFALAWARRGAAARNVGEYAESQPAFEKAFSLRDRATDPERFYIAAHYYRFVADDPAKAVETYKTWRQTYPGSQVPPTNLASLYVNVFGDYAAALPEAREAVRLTPQSSIATTVLFNAYMGTNQVPEARQVLQQAKSHGATDILWHTLAYELAFSDGDEAGMAEQVRWASADPGLAMVMAQHRARAMAGAGRLRESRRLWSEALSVAAQLGPPAWQAAVRIREADVEALLGDPHRARAAIDAALAIERTPATVLTAAMVLVLIGETGRAAALLEEGSRAPAGALCLRRTSIALARALVEARSGRPAGAIETIRTAAPFERGRMFELGPLAIRASIEAQLGRLAEAATTYRHVLRLRHVSPTSPWIPVARLALARALRDQGDIDRSRAAYNALLESMKGADADAPLLLAARRECDALPIRGNPEASGRAITGRR